MTTETHDALQHVKWKYIILFVLIAFVVSAPANLGWWSDTLEESALPFDLDRFKILLQGVGPFIAGIVLRKMDPNRIDSTSKGKYKNTGWIMIGISSSSFNCDRKSE